MRSLFLVTALALSPLVAPGAATACCPPGPPEPIVWTNAVNVVVDGNTLTKTGPLNNWDSGAFSVQALEGPGHIEFTVTGDEPLIRIFGLNQTDSDQSPEDIDFGIWLFADQRIYITAPGKKVRLPYYFQAGDVLRVAIEASSESGKFDVNYYRIRDGVTVLLYTIPKALGPAAFAYHADGALKNDTTIANAMICAGEPYIP
jgi:hypothetical protein